METSVRQIVSDLGINVATKKLVCTKYCQLHNLTKLSGTTKMEIHRILRSIVEELITNPQASICKETDGDDNSSVNSGQTEIQDDDSDTSKGEDTGDSFTNNDKTLMTGKENHRETVMHDTEKKEDNFTALNSKLNAKNKTVLKAKVCLKRLKSKDVLDMVLTSDNNEVSSDGFSSPAVTPQKLFSRHSPKAQCDSPIVRQRHNLIKSRKTFILNSSDSESDSATACEEAKPLGGYREGSVLRTSVCDSDDDSSPDELLHRKSSTSDRLHVNNEDISDDEDLNDKQLFKDDTNNKQKPVKTVQLCVNKETLNLDSSRKRRLSTSSSSSLSSAGNLSDIETAHSKKSAKRASKSESVKETDFSNKKRKTAKSERVKRNTSNAKDGNKTLNHLRKVCRSIGVILRNTIELKGCETDEEKVDRIRDILREKGLRGNPTQKKIEQFKLERELKELGGVTHSSSEGNSRTRSSRPKVASPKKSLPSIHPADNLRNMFSEDDLSD